MENLEIEKLVSNYRSNGIQGLNVQLDSMQLEHTHRLDALENVRQAIDNSKDVPATLDTMQEIYEACVTYALAIANGDERLVQYANATSYNLSANLASCWSDDRRPRSVKHYKSGVAAAQRCLALRVQLNKPPNAFAMAYFILGVHEFSLKNYKAAEDAWLSKLEQERLGFDSHVLDENDLNVILSQGLISLVLLRLGSGDSKNYKESLTRLEAQRNSDNSGEIDLFKSELQLLMEQ